MTVKDELKGKRVRCPKCKELFRADEIDEDGKPTKPAKPARVKTVKPSSRDDDDDDDSEVEEKDTPLTPEEQRRNRQRDKRARLRKVSIGLLIHLGKTWTIVVRIFFTLLWSVFYSIGGASRTAGQAALAGQALDAFGLMTAICGISMLVLAFVASAGGIVGSVYCCFVPRKANARGLAMASAAFDVVSLLAVIVLLLAGFLTSSPDKRIRLETMLDIGCSACSVAAFFSFTIFLRQLALFLKKPDLGTACSNMLAYLIIFVISLPAVILLTLNFMVTFYAMLGGAGALGIAFFIIIGWFAAFYYLWLHTMIKVLSGLREAIAEVT